MPKKMPKKGDFYEVVIKDVHMNWGTKRTTINRKSVAGEGYIPIPANKAEQIGVNNSNALKKTQPRIREQLGVNLFDCYDKNGFVGKLKAQGSSRKGYIYPKQFSAFGDLKVIGSWFRNNKVSAGDKIRVSWTSPTEILIEKV